MDKQVALGEMVCLAVLQVYQALMPGASARHQQALGPETGFSVDGLQGAQSLKFDALRHWGLSQVLLQAWSKQQGWGQGLASLESHGRPVAGPVSRSTKSKALQQLLLQALVAVGVAQLLQARRHPATVINQTVWALDALVDMRKMPTALRVWAQQGVPIASKLSVQ